ncbi:hypothetical protein D3C76_1699160 [compost metagenome]
MAPEQLVQLGIGRTRGAFQKTCGKQQRIVLAAELRQQAEQSLVFGHPRRPRVAELHPVQAELAVGDHAQ